MGEWDGEMRRDREVGRKRKYVKSGIYSKKNKEITIQGQMAYQQSPTFQTTAQQQQPSQSQSQTTFPQLAPSIALPSSLDPDPEHLPVFVKKAADEEKKSKM